MEHLPIRKVTRLKGYDYNTEGAYFITICTKDKQCLLSQIVGTGVLDGPRNLLSVYGRIAYATLRNMSDFYKYVKVAKFVIMPNHIHILLVVNQSVSSPTASLQNSVISQFISTFKRFCNRRYGKNIWQYRSFDHIVRNERDYRRIEEYIENNPFRWTEDCFYIP